MASGCSNCCEGRRQERRACQARVQLQVSSGVRAAGSAHLLLILFWDSGGASGNTRKSCVFGSGGRALPIAEDVELRGVDLGAVSRHAGRHFGAVDASRCSCSPPSSPSTCFGASLALLSAGELVLLPSCESMGEMKGGGDALGEHDGAGQPPHRSARAERDHGEVRVWDRIAGADCSF